MRRQDVAIGEHVDVAHLPMEHLFRGRHLGDVDNFPFRVYLDRSTGALLGHQRVAVGQALTAQHLWALACISPDGFLVVIDLIDAGGAAAVSKDDVAIGERLEDDRNAGKLIFPHELAVSVQLHEAVLGIAVFGEKDAVLYGVRGRSRGGAAQEERNGDKKGCPTHGESTLLRNGNRVETLVCSIAIRPASG